MCGRYALYDTGMIDDHYGASFGELKANYNVAPSHTMPVMTVRGPRAMRWGLIPKWAKDEKIGYKLINARSETVYEKPIWRQVMKNRCLIPANGFYEWQKRDSGKQPFYIQIRNEQLFSFAGIWETWRHGEQEWQTYAILTTEPNKEMSPIHNRMPVILHPENESQWLEADTLDDSEALLRPYEDNGLIMHEVSTAVNTVKTNDETLIGPLNTQ